MAGVEKVDDKGFPSAVLEADLPVVVDFSATWCGPCRLIEPIVKDLAEAYADKVKFVKVDIDEASNVTGQYGVTAVPTLILFKNGEEAGRKQGAVPKPLLEGWIKEHLA